MKIVFDTNVLVDICGATEDLPASFFALDTALMQGHETCITAAATTDLAYLLVARKFVRTSESRKKLHDIIDVFTVLDVTYADCRNAIDSGMPDYEDAVLAFSAQRNDAHLIITRNMKDFLNSPVPALTPQEFVERYKPDNVDYAVR